MWIARSGPLLVTVLLVGCTAPYGAKLAGSRRAHIQLNATALRTGKPGAETLSLLRQYGLEDLPARRPDEAVRRLHSMAVRTGERDMLFALAELSYVAGEQIRRSLKPWDARDAQDYYLSSAVYAWLFLFGDGKQASPGADDRRFREACEYYNEGLGRALTGRRSTNAVVRIESGRRRLPVGEIQLRLVEPAAGLGLQDFDQLLLADQFRVRGFRVRNRTPGVGTPLIGVRPILPTVGVHGVLPVTLLLRIEGSLSNLEGGHLTGALEFYSSTEVEAVTIGQRRVPLETDLTAPRAYALNQSAIWRFGFLEFLSPGERYPSQLILNQPYDPGRIPLVFVHGTFSSPVTWAEMVNTLTLDPLIRKRYQIWSFMYGSGNPLVQSIADLRTALTEQVGLLDPAGTNLALRNMVLIGHSQGGLLVKGTVIESGDRLWRVVNTNRLETLPIEESRRDELRRQLYLEPLSFVQRVVFIATPHRGSYRATGLARRLARRLVSLPGAVASHGSQLLHLAAGSEVGEFFGRRIPTSLDGMSPSNPGLKAMASIPVSPGIRAHSIIAVKGVGDYHNGRDGLVSYQSAHLENVESEYIVRSRHSCLKQPSTIQEVRRILQEHLDRASPGRQE